MEHVKQINAAQQNTARRWGGAIESVAARSLVDDALAFSLSGDQDYTVTLHEEPDLPCLELDRNEVLQILINLFGNAKQAVRAGASDHKKIAIRLSYLELEAQPFIEIQVSDTGVGIAPENLGKIFSHGFTTKKDGHGFGLHSANRIARELGGSMSVHSSGTNQGCTLPSACPSLGPRRKTRRCSLRFEPILPSIA